MGREEGEIDIVGIGMGIHFESSLIAFEQLLSPPVIEEERGRKEGFGRVGTRGTIGAGGGGESMRKPLRER